MQAVLHYFLHLGAPLIIARTWFPVRWKQVYGLLMVTWLIDLDHLAANPIFQADRCSINFHPLHTNIAATVYLILLFLPAPWNVLGLGLLFHLVTDFIDCQLM